MSPNEGRSTLLIAGIYAFRMLGLFMILPVFSLYAPTLLHATPVSIGLALGIYGLTQALLQIPFGMWSDRIGRKPIIILGLVLFMGGSIIAALSHSIEGVMIGRALQGAGAIGSTLIALVADVTTEQSRLKAMSIIGVTIGFSFVMAMIIGPLLNGFVGLSGIFWFTTLLAFLGLIMLYFIAAPKSHLLHAECEPIRSQFKKVLMRPELIRLDVGIFALHAMLTALFIVIPILLVNEMGIAANAEWKIYLPVLFFAAIAMVPFVILAETKNLMKPLFAGAIIVIILIELLLACFHEHLSVMVISLFCFFTAFTFLEACLPSLISKKAPPESKGTAMGIYSSAQFLGIFFGGTLGGLVFHHFGAGGIFIFCTLIGMAWLMLALGMKSPATHK